MVLEANEHCENCLKHPVRPLHSLDNSNPCDRCLPDDRTLQRCKACRIVRYCSRDCQVAHWSQHKLCCKDTVLARENANKAPWDIRARIKTHRKWCYHHIHRFTNAALQALKVWEDRQRIDTHVFLVYIDVEEYVESEAEKRIMFLRTIREAGGATLADVHAMYDQQFALIAPGESQVQSGHEVLERTLAHRPGLLRMMVVDDGLPGVCVPLICSLPVDIPEEAVSLAVSDTDWLSKLKESIAVEWKVTARHQVVQSWFAKHERACIYAGIHAIDLNNHPGRTESHVVMVFLDAHEQVLSERQQQINITHTVQTAYSIPREEVDADFVPALDQLDQMFPRVPGEFTVRMLICDKHSMDGGWSSIHPTTWNVSQFVSNWPAYEPEWLSVFQRRVLIDDG